MPLLLRDGYSTAITNYTYIISDSQFGTASQSYEAFFGLGGGEGDPVGTSFQLGGPIVVDVPFVGEREILRAQFNGDIAATFGLNVLAELNLGTPDPNDPDTPQPGSITATLPYELSVARPDLDPTSDAGKIVDLYFDQRFEHGMGAGFETLFPSLVFKLDLVAEIDARLAAEIGILGENTTIQVLDFKAGTTLSLIDLDTARKTVDDAADPLNIMGVTTPEIIDGIPYISRATDYNGEETGFVVEFAQFFSNDTEKKADVDTERGDTQADEQDDPPDPSGLDLGRLEVFIPNINTVSTFADGIYVTDPNKRLKDGEIVDVDNANNPLNQGNRAELAALTVDLDGVLTYATGYTFPPLEYGFDPITGGFGDFATYSAEFSYNLLDVELRAGLPLEQEFTLTPELSTKLRFYEINNAGTGPRLDAQGNPIAKNVEVVQIAKALTFIESGSVQSDALEARLREIADESLVAARDIELFVDFDAGVPAGFTGQTASIGGRLVMREQGTTEWSALFSGDILAESAPRLGEDQTVEIDTSTIELAYQIFRDDTAADDDEFIALTFEEAAGALEQRDVERVLPISETPYLSDLDVLNLRYDGAETFVEIEHRATPIVTNRTGLEFDLSLLLEGIAASAAFDASVDIGPLTFSAGLDFDIGPLYSERFLLFNAELVDLFNDSFRLDDSMTTSFVLGGPSPAPDFGDAITGTDAAEAIAGTAGADVIVALDGGDTINGGAGDDTIFGGQGADIITGGDGIDLADFSDLPFSLNSGNGAPGPVGTRVGQALQAFEFSGVSPTIRVSAYGPSDVDTLIGIERIRMTDFGDSAALSGDVNQTIFNTLSEVDMGDGGDEVSLSLNATSGIAKLRIEAGGGDDTVSVFLYDYDAESVDLGGWHIDGGAGIDELVIHRDFDLTVSTGPRGETITGFENLTASVLADEGLALTGDDADNILTGSQKADTLIGGDGDDQLFASARARTNTSESTSAGDVFIGGAGADLMRGSSGNDTVDYSTAATSVFVDMDVNGTGRGYRGDAQGDVLENIENVTGSGFDDILIGDGGNNILAGGDGNDRLMAMSHNDRLEGGAGDDLLVAGGSVTRSTQHNNTYIGGDGFDIVAVDVFDPYRQTGTVTGEAKFTYITGGFYSSSTSSNTADVTIDYRYDRSAHVEVRLDENGNGVVRYFDDDRSDTLYGTQIAGTATYSYRPEASITNWFPSYRTKTTNYDINIADKLLADLDGDSIGFSKSGNESNGSGKITKDGFFHTPWGQYDTETLVGIEGLIGSKGNDKLTGNSQANAFFGNGGDDLIRGGAGDDRLGFGDAQELSDVFSFPGDGPRGPNGIGGGEVYKNLEERLVYLNPEGEQSGDSTKDWTPVGKIKTSATATQDIGSFLWGQAGSDTLDMRYDRGISFFPDRSGNYAVVDLNVASSTAPINNFTAEQIQYGRAEWRDANGDLLNFATTYGVENIIGSRNDDILTGDRNDNIIEGGAGADIMDGDAGMDTLSYSLSAAGVTLGFSVPGPTGPLTLVTATGGDATGDSAVDFERFVTSAFDDRITINGDSTGTVTLVSSGGVFDPSYSYARATNINPEVSTFALGAGNDIVTTIGLSRQIIDMGADRDQLLHRGGGGIDADMGAGNDFVTVSDSYAAFHTFGTTFESRVNRFEGGEGFDRITFTQNVSRLIALGDTIVVEMTDLLNPGDLRSLFGANAPGNLLANVNAGVDPIRYELTGFEELVIGNEVIRLDSVDPIVSDNAVFTLLEDATDPFALDIEVPEDEAAAQFRVVSLPEGAALTGPDLGPITPGSLLTATELAALMVVPLQDYGDAPGLFVYQKVGEEDAPDRVVNLPREAPVHGVALGLAPPVDPLGNPLTITVQALPFGGEVFLMEPDPVYLALGLTVLKPRAVFIGERLTPEEVAGLRFLPDENNVGSAGTFRYEITTGRGLRDLRGIDDFIVSIGTRDARDGTVVRAVTFDITPVDDAPDISALLFPMSPDGELDASVTATDPEGDDFELTLLEGPAFGTLQLQPDGGFSYRQTLEIDFGGADFVDDFFTVQAVQANGLVSAPTTQTIRIIDPAALQAIVFDTSRTDVFFDDAGDPIALGGLGTNDTLVGHEGNDRLFGFGGHDSLIGEDGNDTLDGGLGKDTMQGGTGDDYYVTDTPQDLVIERAGEGRDTIEASHDVQLRPHVETVLLNGDAADNLTVFGNESDNTIHGDHGNNRLNGKFGSDLIDASENPLLEGPLVSDDVFFDRDGGDTLIGGLGDDVYRLSGTALGATRIIETEDGGFDFVLTNVAYSVHDNIEKVRLFDRADIDVTGNDQDNEISGNNGDNSITGGLGDDSLRGAAGADTLDGGDGNDKLRGGNRDDLLLGGEGNDVMRGDAGQDTLVGGAGLDRLIGGRGNDELTGGEGPDIFSFASNFGVDTITDFEDSIGLETQPDRLDRISFVDFDTLNAGGPLTFEDLLITQVGPDAHVAFDLDRDGVADRLDLDGNGRPDTARIELLGTDAGALDGFDFVF